MAIPSNQVGFAFQGDVVAGASLLHSAGGRLLKAFSDGGVDIYAVNAAMWLGGSIPIHTSHERIVYQKLASRGWKTSFINKALSIGWGHSDIAIEMARKRSGVAALLLIGALASSGSYYDAAEVFSKLLSATGCPDAEMPNVDVLKNMIAYLAPFTADCGFRSVLQQMMAALRASQAGLHGPSAWAFSGIGADSAWIDGLRQLCFSAEKCEDVFLDAGDRGVWLAAFASFILGMAVKLVLNDETTVWQSAGSRGSVLVHVNTGLRTVSNSSVTAKTGIRITEGSTSVRPITIVQTYPLSEALEMELSFYPQLVDNDNLKNLISCDIVNYCTLIVDTLSYHGNVMDGQSAFRQTRFAMRPSALNLVFEQLGISPHAVAMAARSQPKNQSGPLSTDQFQSPETFAPNSRAKDEIERLCLRHNGSEPDLDTSPHFYCLCFQISQLIASFSWAICKLSLCTFNAKELSVRREYFAGESLTTLQHSRLLKEKYLDLDEILKDLSAMIFLREPQAISGNSRAPVVALSADDVSIYCRLFLEEDCFDAEGRMINIASGKLVFNGILREYITTQDLTLGETPEDGYISYQVAPGTSIRPHYIAHTMTINITATLFEQSIGISCTVNGSFYDSRLPLDLCIRHLLNSVIAPPCRHEVARPLTLLNGESYNTWASGFAADSKKGVNFFALKGRKLEQLLQLAYLEGDTLLQFSCLKCARELAEELLQRGRDKVNIIMV